MPKNKRPVIAVLLGQHEDLYAIHPDYLEAVWASGGLPVLIRYEETTKMLEELSPQGILLTGGVFDFPNHLKEAKDMLPRAKAYLETLAYAEKHKLPTLGICAGMQVLGVYCGAEMINKLCPNDSHRTDKNNSHQVEVREKSLLSTITDKILDVNSRHVQALDCSKTNELNITAVSIPDNVIEAIELVHPWNEFVVGIQWHPENLAVLGDKNSQSIYNAFVEASKKVK